MTTFSIKKYDTTSFDLWNHFVSEAKNATFLFHRNFMDYHSDRFKDHSLLIFEGKKLVAIFPANEVATVIYSHQGITYGGLIYKEIKLAKVIEIFKEIVFYFNQNGFDTMQIKSIPSIYHQKPAEELLYVLFLMKAQLIRRDSLAVIDLRDKLKISKGRIEGVTKGIKSNLKIVEEDKFDVFWNTIMIPNLEAKHNVKPIHTVAEIKLLKSRFPKNIRQFNVYYNEELVAGTTIFESEQVAHAQYISANENKKELGSLDFLYHYLLTEVFASKKFLGFGNSNENNGKNLNQGLSFWKESFGASTTIQDFYEVETKNYNLLENVLI